MDIFVQMIAVLKLLVIGLGAGLGLWGGINLLEGFAFDFLLQKLIALSKYHADQFNVTCASSFAYSTPNRTCRRNKILPRIIESIPIRILSSFVMARVYFLCKV